MSRVLRIIFKKNFFLPKLRSKIAIINQIYLIEEFMREVYERVEDNTPISIEVDTDAIDMKHEFNMLFSVFVKPNLTGNTVDVYEECLELKESMIIAVEYEGNAKYVGTRIVDGWHEIYFYTSTAKELNTLVASLLGESGHMYESHVVKDKKWDFYEKQLFPTELDFAHIQSDKIILLLQDEGDDLAVPRDVEHYVSFETPTQKERFIENVQKDGFIFKDDIANDEFAHGVALVKSHDVTKKTLQEVVDSLFEKIKESHGYYEGWSTTLASQEGGNVTSV